MKAKTSLVVAVAMVIISVLAPFNTAQAQGSSVFTWTEDKNGNTTDILTTPTVTNTQFPTEAIDYYTSYHSDFSLVNGSLTAYRPSISRSDLGSSVVYSAGPLIVPTGGTIIDFTAWLNPSAQAGSSESIFNIVVNGIAIAQTITANSGQPLDQFEFVSSLPITDIQFDYGIHAVSNNNETGIGLDVQVVPEPTTVALSVIGTVMLIFKRRK